MATFDELANITNEPGWDALIKRCQVAVAIKAVAIIDSATPGVAALEWARMAVSKPSAAAADLYYYVVAKNADMTIAQIIGASDTAVQNQISAAVDAIYGV